jgi:hypothetical protein
MPAATAFAFCGTDCEMCPVHIATLKNDDQLRQKTAKEWSALYRENLERFGIQSLNAEDINCFGCRSGLGLFIGCASCSIRKCCDDKGFTTCASCDDFESCNLLDAFYSSEIHQSAKKNLERMRMKRR